MTSATILPVFRTVFSLGFRPFFLGAGVWASFAMALWLGFLSGMIALPGLADPVAWHAHELTFGYVGAALAGFLLTAAPNWTRQQPVTGPALAALFTLWLAGRGALLLAAVLPAALVAAVDLAFGVVLSVLLGSQVWRGRNWRNLSVLAAVLLWLSGNLLFHWEAAHGGAAGGFGLRVGLAGAVTLVGLVGGRVVPAFTRNWLKARGAAGFRPDPDWLDRLANLALAGAALGWALWPSGAVTAAALTLVGGLHLWRLARWGSARTLGEPLLWVLHLSYLFVGLGAIVLALAAIGLLGTQAAQHVWAAGAVGLTTLAVMTRATLGHSGAALSAGGGTAACYSAVALSAVLRPLADLVPSLSMPLLLAAALCWGAAFAVYVALYGARQLGLRAAAG